MPVPDGGDVVVGVEKAAPMRVVEIHALAPHEMQRLLVGKFQATPKEMLTAGFELCRGGTLGAICFRAGRRRAEFGDNSLTDGAEKGLDRGTTGGAKCAELCSTFWVVMPAPGVDCRADCVPGDNCLEYGREFGVLKRENGVVAGDDLRCVVYRGEICGRGLGGGNGDVENQRAVNHVPEIEQANDGAQIGINQHVARVAVVMDDLAAQARQVG